MEQHEVFLNILIPDFLKIKKGQDVNRGDGKRTFLSSYPENYAISDSDFEYLQSHLVSLMGKYDWGLFRFTEDHESTLLLDDIAKGVLLKKEHWLPKKTYPLYYIAPKGTADKKG